MKIERGERRNRRYRDECDFTLVKNESLIKVKSEMLIEFETAFFFCCFPFPNYKLKLIGNMKTREKGKKRIKNVTTSVETISRSCFFFSSPFRLPIFHLIFSLHSSPNIHK